MGKGTGGRRQECHASVAAATYAKRIKELLLLLLPGQQLPDAAFDYGCCCFCWRRVLGATTKAIDLARA